MVAIKVQDFGGMIPAMDDRLLPQNNAALSQNAWVYTGAIEGLRSPVAIYTPSNSLTKKVYRIPKTFFDKDHIPDSYWLEFTNADTDVIRSPTVGDTFERYYWASSQSYANDPPYYNTRARIIAGQTPYLLGIPAPTVAPGVSRMNGAYVFNASSLNYSTVGYRANLYKSAAYAVDSNTKQVGPVNQSTPALRYRVQGGRAELRYGTTNSGLRITVSDEGIVTVGVPSPATSSSPTVPPPGQGVLESRAYVYTWVSAYGEEGPPSPATVATAYSGDPWVIKVSAPSSSVTTNRNITKTRVYRTITASSGATTYFYVDEFPIAQTVYTDTIGDDVVSENSILESTYWTPPPTDLEGMISMPNGIIAGWRDNEIWFCEPYRPHAWPAPYAVAVENQIVGLGVIGQTLVVCTTGYPYAITGINPANMVISRIATYEPCMSRGSIVSSQEGVYYVSPNGLVLCVAGTVQVVTRNLVTKDHWLDYMYADTTRAARLSGSYYVWGSIKPGCFEPSAFNSDVFVQTDYSGSYTGALIDVNNQRVAFTELITDTPTVNVWTDHWTGEVFILRGGKVYWLDLSTKRAHSTYKWRSKIFDFPNKRNLEAMRVFWGVPDGSTDYSTPGTVRVYADNRLVFTRPLVSSGEFMRLPSGFRATYWQVEVEGVVPVYSIEFATSAKELANV